MTCTHRVIQLRDYASARCWLCNATLTRYDVLAALESNSKAAAGGEQTDPAARGIPRPCDHEAGIWTSAPARAAAGTTPYGTPVRKAVS